MAMVDLIVGFLIGLGGMTTTPFATFDQRVTLHQDNSAKIESVMTAGAEESAKLRKRKEKEGEKFAKDVEAAVRRDPELRKMGVTVTTFRLSSSGDAECAGMTAYCRDASKIGGAKFSLPCRVERKDDGTITATIGRTVEDPAKEYGERLKELKESPKDCAVTITYLMPGEIVTFSGFESLVTFKGRELTVKATKAQIVKLLEEGVKKDTEPPLTVKCKAMTPDAAKEFEKFKEEIDAAEKAAGAEEAEKR